MPARRRTPGSAAGLPGQGGQAADRPQVLLAVAAREQLGREHLVQRRRRSRAPGRRGRTAGRRAPPGAALRPGRRPGARRRPRPAARRRPARRSARGAVDDRCASSSSKSSHVAPASRRSRGDPASSTGAGGAGRAAVPVVLAVDAHRLEVRRPGPGSRAGSPARRSGPRPARRAACWTSPRPARRRRPAGRAASTPARCRPGRRARTRRSPAAGDRDSASTVVAKPSAPTRWVSSTKVPYALGSGRRATARRAGGSCRRRSRRRGRRRVVRSGALAPAEQPLGAASSVGEALQHLDGRRLRGLRRVGQVGVEAGAAEARRRHQSRRPGCPAGRRARGRPGGRWAPARG